MSRGSCPWEAPSIVFYNVWRLLGGPDSDDLIYRVGPPKETKDRIFGSSEVTNVSRIVALGGSIYRILRVSEGPGSSRFRVAKRC